MRSAVGKTRGTAMRRLVVAIVIALPHGAAFAQDTPAKCQLVQIAQWPVRLAHNKILLDGTVNGRKVGTVNGRKVGIAVDTGAAKSLIFRSSVERLGLKPRDVRGMRMYGVGGETRVQAADIDEITIGDVTRKDMQVFVAGENDFSTWGDLVLGEDFLAKADVEFDLAHKAVRLFQPRNCERASLAYWASDGGSSVDIEHVDDTYPHIGLKVEVNGVEVDALLDSGAGMSLLDSTYARQVGVTPDAPGVTAVGKLRGFGAKPIDAWRGTFATIVVGNERIRDAELVFADFRRVHQERTGTSIMSASLRLEPMLLGADFILAHRLLVSHSKHRMYFTYVGGPVFGAPRRGDEPASPGADGARTRQ